MSTFTTTLLGGAGSAAGIEVPEQVVKELAAGKRPPVQVTINGHTFLSTIAVMGGRYLIAVNAAARKSSGLRAGDTTQVQLLLDTTPRTVEVPDDLARALAAQPGARQAFDTLTPSKQRRAVVSIEQAKSLDTRQRRIDKTVGELR